MMEYLKSIIDAIKGFFGFFESIKDWLYGIITLLKNCFTALGSLLSSFTTFPVIIITFIIAMITIAIIFRALGR